MSTADRPLVLCIQHEDLDPPAWVGEWLEQAGARLDVRRCHAGDPLPPDLADHHGLLVMGGVMGAHDDADHPWLAPTKDLVRVAVADSVPLLGICLGHQLAAVALGGDVAPSPDGPHIGVFDLGLTPDGEADPLLGAMSTPVPAVQWNNDVVTALPPGAVVLARGRGGAVQALRLGPRAWGLQLHPEVGADLVGRWGAAEVEAAHALGLDPVSVTACVAETEPRLRAAWGPVARRFAGLASERAREVAAGTARA